MIRKFLLPFLFLVPFAAFANDFTDFYDATGYYDTFGASAAGAAPETYGDSPTVYYNTDGSQYYKQTIDGIEWRYTVSDGKVSVGGGDYTTAVPKHTSGTITIPSAIDGCPVVGIRDYAFASCSNLVEVVIPEGVQSIERRAFMHASSLTRLAIPTSVTSIAMYYTFLDCDRLAEIVVADGNPTFETHDGILFDTIRKRLVFCPSRKTGDVMVPTGTEAIGDYAFYGCSGLTSIAIPDSVTSIGSEAFSGCSGLTSITIPDGVTNIGLFAFYKCRGLTSITIPDSVKRLGDSTFLSCSGLKSVFIGNGLASFDWADQPFDGCPALVEAYLPFRARGYLHFPSGCRIYYYRDLSVFSDYGHPQPSGKSRIVGTDPVSVACSVESFVPGEVDGIRHACTGWTGTGSTPATGTGTNATFVLDMDSTLTWNWETQALVSISIVGDGACSFGEQWIRVGNMVSATIVPVDTPFDLSLSGDTDGVSANGTTLAIPVDRPRHLVATVHLRDPWLDISSEHAAPSPMIGRYIYPKNTEILAFVSNPEPADGVQFVCTGWRGTGSVPSSGSTTNVSFLISDDSTLVWNWTTNFWIDCEVCGMASSSFSPGWHDSGSTVVVPFSSSAAIASCRLFGDTNGVAIDYSRKRITFPADAPRALRVELVTSDLGAILGPDGTLLSFASTGDADWFATADASSSAGSCFRSGVVGSGESSTVETSVSGAGLLSFRWKISGNRGDWCRFFVDGVETNSIVRDENWGTVKLELGEGEHTLRWSWEKSASAAAGENGAFLDDVCWRPYVWIGIQSAFGDASPAVGMYRFLYGDTVSASVVEPAPADGTRHVYTGWTASGSAPASGTGHSMSFTIRENTSIAWNWRTDHWIDVSVSGDGSAAFVPQWVEDGTIATMQIAPATHLYEIILSGDTDGTTLVGTTLSVPSDGPRTISVLVREVKLSLAIESAHGNPSPTSGVHSVSWGAEIAATVDEPAPSNGVQYACMGWMGAGSAPAAGSGTNAVFTIEEDSSLVWQWRTNVWLSLSRSGPLAASLDAEWVEKGAERLVYYEPLAERYTLAFSGDTNGVAWDRDARTLRIPADAPRELALDLRVLTLSVALDANGFAWTTTGSALWIPVADESAEGGVLARSGEVYGYNESILATTLSGPGTFSWLWKLEGDDLAGVDVELDGRFVLFLERPCDWTPASIDVTGSGEHVLRFIFWNAGTDPATHTDRAWIDGAAWTGAAPPAAVTKESPIPVPYSWLAAHAPTILEAALGNYEDAAVAKAANGRSVWECYIAGIDDPEDPTADFRAEIEIVDGIPVVTFDPDLGFERRYAIDGKENLSDNWGPTNDWSRFFRARVSLPADWAAAGTTDGFPETVTVTLDPNGGTVDPAALTYTAPGMLGPLPTPSRFGYSFLGWYSREMDGTLFTSESLVPWADVTLYAHYGFYSIRFDANGGEGTMSDLLCAMNTTIVLPSCAFTRTGYTFVGWSSGVGSVSVLFPGDEVCNLAIESGDVTTLHAVWTPNRYSVHFDPNGGMGEMEDQQLFLNVSSSLCTNSYFRPGCLFHGWSTNRIGAVVYDNGAQVLNINWTTNDSLTLYAIWYPDPRFSSLSEALNSSMCFETGGDGDWFSESDFTHDGSLSAQSGSVGRWKNSWIETTVTGPGTISFWWKTSCDIYSRLSFDLDNVQQAECPCNGNDWTFVSVQITNPGTHSLKWIFDERNGVGLYSDCGWLDEVFWISDNYTVQFDANGGIGRMMELDGLLRGENVPLPFYDFLRNGWTFVGWAASADGAVEWADGEMVKGGFFDIAENGTVTLYARWSQESYTVRFAANGGTGMMQDTTLWCDVPQALPRNTFEKEGASFAGWATNATGDVVYANSDIVENLSIDDGTITLWAVWSERAPGLTVRYYDVSGSGYSTWTQSATALTNYFAGLTPTIVTNTSDWGESLQSGFQGDVSGYFRDYPGLWLDNAPTNRYHGKYANKSQDHFAMLFEGELVTIEEGAYCFAASCDNDMVLYIDGTLVCSFQWPTSNEQPRSATGSLPLSPGSHRIMVATYESTGNQGMFVEWKQPGETVWSPLPQSAFSLKDAIGGSGVCLSFNANGGEGVPPATIVAMSGKIVVIPANTFFRPGYTFGGWSALPDGPVLYLPGDEVAFDADATLYAQWLEDSLPQMGSLSVRYYDVSSSGYSTWTQSEAAMTNYFSARTPTIVTNTSDWGESLQSGFQEDSVSYYFQDYPGLWLDVVSTNRYHGKYANKSQDNFAMYFEGELVTSQAGTFSFAASCDDAIVLYIDGVMVCSLNISNWDLQSSTTGTISLSSGRHRIKIATYEGGGSAGMFVEWKQPGETAWSPLPQSVLSHSLRE